MNAFWALIPVIVIRYILLGVLNKDALKRAAHFPEMPGRDKAAYLFYQISTLLLFVYPFFLKVTYDYLISYIGLAIYGLGITVSIVATFNFARPDKNGLTTKGLYRLLRHPMYIGHFLSFLGCVVMTRSLILLAILIVFQISAHWIVLAEERWCIEKFGEEYIRYKKKVRRYL